MEGQRRGRSLRRKFLPVLLWLRGAGVRCLQALRRRARGLATAAAFTVALAGCTPWKEYLHNGFKVGPNYSRPPAPVAQKWIDEGQQGVSTKSDELRAWWTVFQDPVLNDLVCCAVNQNLNVRQAGFRVLQYRALLGFAIGRLFPQTQTFDAGYNHTAVSIKVANRFATPQRFFSTWGYGFNLGWELDFWGKYRRFIEEYQDRYDAQIEDYDAVLVTLLGDVANEYVQMRTLQAQLAYTLINVKLQEETLGIAQTKYNAGQINELDVDQATSILQQTRALVPQLEIQIRQAGNRLCVLLGIPPEDLAKKLPPRPIPNAPPEVCVGIPAQLLTRRPDIRQAEREAAAESARIGIEVAELYPAISVVGNIGWGAEYFTNLFNAGAWRGSVGPSVDWKLLYYGRILSLINAQGPFPGGGGGLSAEGADGRPGGGERHRHLHQGHQARRGVAKERRGGQEGGGHRPGPVSRRHRRFQPGVVPGAKPGQPAEPDGPGPGRGGRGADPDVPRPRRRLAGSPRWLSGQSPHQHDSAPPGQGRRQEQEQGGEESERRQGRQHGGQGEWTEASGAACSGEGWRSEAAEPAAIA